MERAKDFEPNLSLHYAHNITLIKKTCMYIICTWFAKALMVNFFDFFLLFTRSVSSPPRASTTLLATVQKNKKK